MHGPAALISPAEVLQRVQALRLVAATLVVLGHAKHEALNVLGLGSAASWSLAPAALFAGGVDIFFVISGFIMFTISGHEFGRPGAPSRFLLRRLTRIVPAYWLFTAAMAAVAWLLSERVQSVPPGAWQLLASLLFLPHFNGQGQLYPVLTLGWTLNFEMLFYVLFAFGLCLPRRAGLPTVVTLVMALALVGAWHRPEEAPFAFWCHPVVLEFLFGILLARVRARGLRWSPGLGASVALAGFVLLYVLGPRGAAEPLAPQRVLWMGLPALAICAAAVLVPERAVHSAWQRALAAGGDASYALYLSHPFVLGALGVVWPLWGPRQAGLYILMAYLACVTAALAFHRAIERPMTRALNARLGVGPGSAAALGLGTAKGVAQ
jgi:peptidoglycan/LPS O-acetylase OafA/YrhL